MAWLIGDHFAAGVDDEVRLVAAVDGAAHGGEAMHPHRQLEVLRLLRQVLAEGQLVRLVVDHHRVAERKRRQPLGFLDRDAAQRRVLDETRDVAQLQRTQLQ